MVRYALSAEEAAAILGDEQVVFYSDAAEVFVCLYFVVADEIGMQSLGLPVVNEVGDEIDAWFIGHHEILLESTAHAQAVGSELCGGLCFFVEAHILLSEPLHVVYVHTHHVTQSVRQKECMSSSPYGLFGIALHKSHLFESVCHQSTYVHVHIIPFYSWFSHLKGIVVAVYYYLVYLLLSLGVCHAHGEGACIVRTIIIEFATCIAECEASLL